MITVALVGGSGRMGAHITDLLNADPRFRLAFVVNDAADWPGDRRGVDVVIDFSQPAGLDGALRWCVTHGVRLVSGTTGLSDQTKRAIEAAAQTIPLLYSANMSPGIAVMSAMLDAFTNLSEWDFHVDEVHHNQKKDAPSGTALLLDKKLGQVLGRSLPTPNSVRGGSVPGIHQVWAMGPDEVLVLQHTAFDRKVFARGAVKAAGWLFDKAEPGLYELKDLYKK